MQNQALGQFICKLQGEDMPMFAKTSKTIVEIASKEDSSISDLTWCILKDSALTAKVLKLANGVMFNRDYRKVNTVSRATLQLGLKTIKSICISSLLIENVTGSKKDKVIQEMMKSFHAAVQARGIAQLRRDPAVEEIFISSLLYRIGNIAFWCFGSELADQLEKAIASNPDEKPDAIERKLLGFSLRELTFGLVQEWGLSDLLSQTLTNPTQTPKGKTLLIGHALANAADAGWNSRQMNQAISALGDFTKLGKEEAMRLAKECAEEAVKSAKDYGLEKHSRLIPVSAGTATGVTSDSVSMPQYDPLLQLEIISELNAMVKDKQFNLNLFLTILIEGISRGVGMDRVVLLIMSSDKKSLCGRYGLGWEQKVLETIRFSVKPMMPNVFSELVVEKTPAWVNGNKSRYGRYITEEIKTWITTPFFFAAPVVINNVVVGVICADRDKSKRELDAKSFSCFEYLITTANAVLSAIL